MYIFVEGRYSYIRNGELNQAWHQPFGALDPYSHHVLALLLARTVHHNRIFQKGAVASSSTMVKIPTEENRQRVVTLLEDFIKLLESHSGWTPPRPNAALFHVWDFVKRSQYIATELDNIRQGKPVAFPDQIPSYNKRKLQVLPLRATLEEVC